MIQKLKNFTEAYVRFVQKILVTVSLFFLYTIGFGITYVFARIFRPELLGIKKEKKNTFWKDFKKETVSLDSYTKQI